MSSVPPAEPVWLAQYRKLARLWARGGANRHDAEDAAQDAALRCLERAGSALEDPSAYLRRSVANRLVSLHRAQRVRQAQALHELAEPEHPAAASAEAHYQARQLAERLTDALCELPPACQEAFRLRRFDGLSNGEIAERLGVSRNMVERHMMRAMRYLHDRMGS
ncbi:sigma-70 family RNA polymerase sigma factor [Orrella dioscoreae]|uniref:Sigma-70 factor FpvI (ECF subfamily), controling pyoverdin biosynthesis @ FIG006045: Sigma factor, ECF subfamily n=1 Tax=Orrella dioscoreae TaxID=1851544 RepID=A0A1C3JXI1_9BURK|nr:sigma-70 family RNA polymerase sigma factor [Orrella dioscoreae]SBT23936.1 Sigma-70 factor FpvI (ECF subfamily), controling pyoverdin biosynthesis @ FIG006045: Sigma factor, ECF subfamily [Orrella dioscoreae]SOE47250.1 Sigma-70 factor FpvI (ECF subfamily), controling pyoverdin biosynthesis @ FIG006045: Sigma factor, ECF subfamily [Orrella dioscoreae]